MTMIHQGDIFNFIGSLGYDNWQIIEAIKRETKGTRSPISRDISCIRSRSRNGIEGLNAEFWYDYFIEEYLKNVTDMEIKLHEGTKYEKSRAATLTKKKGQLLNDAKKFVKENGLEFDGWDSKTKNVKTYVVKMFECGFANYKKRNETPIKYNTVKISQSDIKPPKDFKGRKETLEEIKSILDRERAVILRGIGGIGKTFVAKQYANCFDYECKQLITCQKSFTSYKQLLLELKLDGATEDKFSEEEKLNNRKKLIQTTENKTILIFDNVDKSLDDSEIVSDILSQYNNVHMIFTTRLQDSETIAEVIDISTLSKEEQRELFETHLKQKIEEEDEVYVQKILEKIAGHTFLIELVAKSIAAAFYDYKKIYDYLNREDTEDIPEITAKKDGRIIQDVNLKEMVHILLFDIGSIEDDKEKEALYLMSLLPLDGIPKKLFGELFISYRNALNKLQGKGWIKEEEYNGVAYVSIHPVICDVVRDEYQPTYDNCFDTMSVVGEYVSKDVKKSLKEDICEFIINIMDVIDIQKNDYSKEKIENLKNMADFLRKNYRYNEALSMYKVMLEICGNNKADDNTWYNVYIGMGELYQRLAHYTEAILMFQKAVECATENSKQKAEGYRKLGEVYRKSSDYPNAEKFDLKAIEIFKGIGNVEEEIAEATNALGVVYINMADSKKVDGKPNKEFLKKALEKYRDAFEIWNKINDSMDQIAFSNHNIGTVYYKLEKYDEALGYHLRGLSIRKENALDETYIGASYAWLCKDYVALGNKEEAKKYIDLSLEIREKRLGKDHPDYAWALDSKCDMCEAFGEYNAALNIIKEVVRIRMNALGAEHEYTKRAIARLEEIEAKAKNQ